MVRRAARLGIEHPSASPLERLAAFGGPDTPVLAGLILATASMNGAILIDGPATGAAALAAIALQPAVRGYVIPAHRGSGLDAPIFDVGLGHGEGTGAAMLLSLVDRVCALLEPTA
jgi:nicotinate-nucleotide--dimethylbenzimidazole phosphoribosyltransferase